MSELNKILKNYEPVVIDGVEKIFKSDKELCEFVKSEYDNVPRYGISTGNEDCAFIQLFDDHIYIELLERCGINGSQTIRKIEQLAVKLENISYIRLEYNLIGLRKMN